MTISDPSMNQLYDKGFLYTGKKISLKLQWLKANEAYFDAQLILILIA